MPHLTIETSRRVRLPSDPKRFFTDLFVALEQLGHFKAADCKGRVHQASHYAVGEGADREFVHATFAILEGRPPEVRAAAAELILSRLSSGFESVIPCDRSVEVREMERAPYRKVSGI